MPIAGMEERRQREHYPLPKAHGLHLHCPLIPGSNSDSTLVRITWTQLAPRCRPEETSGHVMSWFAV